MLRITPADIDLHCEASNRDQALALAAQKLQSRGLVTADFKEALLKREHEVSTWIGAGVAMPHASRKNASSIINNGFHILQFPQGIEWERGKIVFLVVAVAAFENKHIDVLSGLAELLDDELKVTVLSRCKNTEDFITTFNKA